MRFHLLFLLALATLSSVGQAWQVWDMDNSPLPSTTVKALVEDGQGGLWVGTDWGLCHFDGEDTWEVYQQTEGGLPGNDINALARDGQGRIWVATTAGLVVKDGALWTAYTTTNSPIPEDEARGLFVDHLDRVWIATSGGLACFTGTAWNIYNATPESYNGLVLNTGNTRCVAVRPDGLVCLGTFNGGLHFITDASVHFLSTFTTGFFDNTATGVLFDPLTGDRWVATPSAGLLRQQGPTQGGVWYQWNSSIAFPSNGITCLDMDPQRRVWCGTQIFGLVRVDLDGSFDQFNEVNSGLPDDEVRSVLTAGDGAVWVGTTYGGLARLTEDVGIGDSVPVLGSSVFPNPAQGSTTIIFDTRHSGTVHWRLHTVDGNLVRTGSATPTGYVLSLSGLAAGSYLLTAGMMHLSKSFVYSSKNSCT